MGASGTFEHRRRELFLLRNRPVQGNDNGLEELKDVDLKKQISDEEVYDSFVAGAEPGERFYPT